MSLLYYVMDDNLWFYPTIVLMRLFVRLTMIDDLNDLDIKLDPMVLSQLAG